MGADADQLKSRQRTDETPQAARQFRLDTEAVQAAVDNHHYLKLFFVLIQRIEVLKGPVRLLSGQPALAELAAVRLAVQAVNQAALPADLQGFNHVQSS